MSGVNRFYWTASNVFDSSHFALSVIWNPFGCLRERPESCAVGTRVYHLDSLNPKNPLVDKGFVQLFIAAVDHAMRTPAAFEWKDRPARVIMPGQMTVRSVKVSFYFVVAADDLTCSTGTVTSKRV